jgi:hypothetical protein
LTARRRGGEDGPVPRDRGLLAIVGVMALCGPELARAVARAFLRAHGPI